MKIRNGFVSNSSSSSFIVGIAEVTLDQKVSMEQKYKDKSYHSPDFLSGEELLAIDNWGISNNGSNTVEVSGGGNSGCSVYMVVDPNKDYVVVNINNDEGDSAFTPSDDSWDLDYDIDLDFFPEWQQELYAEVSNLKNSSIKFGAERNG